MKNQTKMSAEKVEIKQKPKLQNIKLEKLRPFEEHPYKILDDESMEELKTSIAEKGLLNRIIVRPLEDTPDEYEIISGHSRVHAAELLSLKEVPAVIHFIDRDEATKNPSFQRRIFFYLKSPKSHCLFGFRDFFILI